MEPCIVSWKYTWSFCYAFTSTMDWSHKIGVTQWNDVMDESAMDTAHRRVHCKILSNAALLSFCRNAVHTIATVALIAAFLESLVDDRVKILFAVVLLIQFCIRGSVETRCHCFEMLQYLTTATEWWKCRSIVFESKGRYCSTLSVFVETCFMLWLSS